MVESFSGGYYLTQMLVTPYGGDRAVLALDLFDKLQQEYSWTHPLVFKVDRLYVPAYGETAVPPETLAIPNDVWERLDMGNPKKREVLLAKKGTVEHIISSYEALEGAVAPQ